MKVTARQADTHLPIAVGPDCPLHADRTAPMVWLSQLRQLGADALKDQVRNFVGMPVLHAHAAQNLADAIPDVSHPIPNLLGV
mmetsp:Transcript_28517/g.76940  ORF Transcript_28517/g.76940 Transcript_28517/m.76940 type:complete len:83 (-) Transcript_28517:78-326(-)